MKPVPVTPEEGIDRSQLARRVAASQTFACSHSDPVGPAQSGEVPPTLLQLEPQPLSAYDDNPVFNEAGAAFIRRRHRRLPQEMAPAETGP